MMVSWWCSDWQWVERIYRIPVGIFHLPDPIRRDCKQ